MTDHPPNPSASDYEGAGGPYTSADISEHVADIRERAVSGGLSDGGDSSDRLSELIDEAREKVYQHARILD